MAAIRAICATSGRALIQSRVLCSPDCSQVDVGGFERFLAGRDRGELFLQPGWRDLLVRAGEPRQHFVEGEAQGEELAFAGQAGSSGGGEVFVGLMDHFQGEVVDQGLEIRFAEGRGLGDLVDAVHGALAVSGDDRVA
ncbi:MAG: hypothetical protein HQK81_15060 [Desulfovibrionaceae bacterium]|nr:hypothetical protein [Desulfovibrionaceae bacterium]